MASPYEFVGRGGLFITRPMVNEVPYQAQPFTKPREFSLWVSGRIQEPAFQLDHVRMPPSLYQDVRNDLIRYSPVEVSRSAFRRSMHSYTGVIDSKGKPYYFTLDSRGISVREVSINDEKVWKTFDRLADEERSMALRKRRHTSMHEMEEVDRELSTPLVIVKSEPFVEALSKAEVHTGTMVSLHLPHEIAEQIALPGGEASSSMHITFAYLGKDLTEEQKSLAVCAVRRFAQQAGPIKAVLGGVGRFSASQTSEGNDVIYLSVDSPDITRLRPKLLEELAAEGIEPSNAHGFVPHVTLMYVKTTEDTPIKRFPPLAVEFPSVSLTVANQQMPFPFTKTDPALIIMQKAVGDSDGMKIGKTRTNKPVFSHAHPLSRSYTKFSASDHRDASKSHAAKAKLFNPGSTRHEHHTGMTKMHAEHANSISGNYKKQSHEMAARAMWRGRAHSPPARLSAKEKAGAGGASTRAAFRAFKSEIEMEITKALPKKSNETTVKKTPTRKASQKKVGVGGKPRYTYPNEKKGGAKKPAGAKTQKPQPLLVVHDDSKNADPAEFVNQLGVSMRTLQRCAKQLGREGFSKFMRSHLKRFSAKHRISSEYWNTLFGMLQPGVG